MIVRVDVEELSLLRFEVTCKHARRLTVSMYSVFVERRLAAAGRDMTTEQVRSRPVGQCIVKILYKVVSFTSRCYT